MNNYIATFKLNGIIITKKYNNVSEEMLKKYVEIYKSLSQATFIEAKAI